MKTAKDKSARYLKSNFYEQLVEHAFISELLQEAWFRYGKTVEVLRLEGYGVRLGIFGFGVIHKKVGPDFPGETFCVLKKGW
jgi:hypothetical protein